MEDIKAIDVMNYPFTTESKKPYYEAEEVKILQRTLFAGAKQGAIPIQGCSTEEFIAEMDEVGYDKVFISAFKMFSHRNKKLIVDYSVDEVYEMIKDYPDRLIGRVGYNPFRIEESLREIERGVKEFGFKGVYFHSLSFNLALNDRKLYPCYAKCSELGVPVSMQTGHSAEIMPSEPGRPIYLDEVALDFPELTIVASHTGWPWVDEFVSMVWKHERVYCDVSAWMPKLLPTMHAPLMWFMNSRIGGEKTLFGTNGMGLKVFKQQFLELPIQDEIKRKVMRENAIKVYNL